MANEERDNSSDKRPAAIHAQEHPLKKIFSPDFEYTIPPYQRPYAWTLDQASDLFDDLFASYESKTEQYYFLGSIVLIKPGEEPKVDVIDGQQRLTTLTILLSALTSFLEDPKEFLNEYIWERGRPFEGLERKPRLTLREKDSEFFMEYVQNLNFEQLVRLDDESLANESQKNIKKNSQLFLQKIKEAFDNNTKSIQKFLTFLVKYCFLVVVLTPSRDSAYRVFSVLNSRGLDLQMTDFIKAEIIGELATDEEQDIYNKRWENMEDNLNRDVFNDLFNYVRMIFVKARAK